MDDLLHDDDLLVLYLDGELPSAQKVELERRLQQDSKLQERLTALRVATEAVKQYGTSQQVKAIHHEMMKELKDRPTSGKVVGMRRALKLTMAVAASILVVFIGFRLYFASQVSAEGLYTDAFVDFQVSVSRGANPGFSAIEKAYQEKNYEAVVQSIRSTQLDSKDSLLVGLSYMHVNKTSQAINIFHHLTLSENEFRQDAEFYLALAYLKDSQEKKSLPLVEKINANSAHLYHERFDNSFVEKLKRLTAN